MARVYLGIGSNLGDRNKNIHQAISLLNLAAEIQIINVSPIIETAPYGYLEQSNFLNGALLVETTLSPICLLNELQRIETTLKRERKQKWGPRTIDLDILFYDNLVIQQENLKIPHPELHKRFFVLKPLSDIAPELIHPVLNISIIKLLDGLSVL